MKSIPKFLICWIGLSSFTACFSVWSDQSQLDDRLHQLSNGKAVFHFSQNDEFAAITQLLIAEKTIKPVGQAVESKLLLADYFYSYGLYTDSERLFSSLVKAQAPDRTRNLAWFNLARLQYQQGLFSQAGDYLANIDDNRLHQNNPDLQYLLANIYLGNQQYLEAGSAGLRIKESSLWRPHADYNLAVTLIESDQFERGRAMLEKLSAIQTNLSTLSALREQASLALGLSLLKRGDYQDALSYLLRVRLKSPLGDKALLAAGWAWHFLNQPEKALALWSELTEKNTVNPATQEAFVAIPTLFEKNHQNELALEHYDIAAKSLDRQLNSLDQAIVSIKQNDFFDALQQQLDSFGPFVIETNPPTSIATAYIYELLASDSFQLEIKRWRELQAIQKTLMHWNRNIPILTSMLDERRRNFNLNLPQLTHSRAFQALEKLKKRRNMFANKLFTIERDNDYLSLSTVGERRQLERLEQVAERLENLKGGDNIKDERERYRYRSILLDLNRGIDYAPKFWRIQRLESITKVLKNLNRKKDYSDERVRYRLLNGLLHWQIESDFGPRFKLASDGLGEVDNALLDSDRSAGFLRNLAEKINRQFSEFESRIVGKDAQVISLNTRVTELIARQQSSINQLAIDEIQRQRQHIIQLRLSTRFSLARLHDSMADK